MSENPTIPSPCVSICLLDKQDICRGCYRSGEEIRGWIMMSDVERLEVLNFARKRSQYGNPFAAG